MEGWWCGSIERNKQGARKGGERKREEERGGRRGKVLGG